MPCTIAEKWHQSIQRNATFRYEGIWVYDRFFRSENYSGNYWPIPWILKGKFTSTDFLRRIAIEVRDAIKETPIEFVPRPENVHVRCTHLRGVVCPECPEVEDRQSYVYISWFQIQLSGVVERLPTQSKKNYVGISTSGEEGFVGGRIPFIERDCWWFSDHRSVRNVVEASVPFSEGGTIRTERNTN